VFISIPSVPTQSRRLAFVTPQYFDVDSYLGGGERYPLNLARGVVRATGGRSRVKIISFGPGAREVEIDDGITMTVLPAAYLPDHELNSVAWGLVDALEDADVVHAHQVFSRSGEAAILIASILDKPVFATDLGAWASTVGMRYGMLDLTAGVICISDFAAGLINTQAPVEVIRGGVDTEVFTPAETPPSRDHVLYVGRLLPHKGIEHLIDAMPADLRLVVCGHIYDDAYHQHLRSAAEGKPVEFETAASDHQLLSLYRTAVATVLPSVYRDYAGNFQRAPELMGLTLIESMACGTPAVCSRVGGMPELIRHGETGFIYDCVDDLRNILAMLQEDRRTADTVGAAGRQAAVAEYDIGTVGRRVVALYEEALARR
jgi:glycosyltransferase involved in cell wall biosynthesis